MCCTCCTDTGCTAALDGLSQRLQGNKRSFHDLYEVIAERSIILAFFQETYAVLDVHRAGILFATLVVACVYQASHVHGLPGLF